MEEYKLDLKELATVFEWNVHQLSEVMGYSTPGLYHIFRGGNIDVRRFLAALNHLKLISDLRYEDAIKNKDCPQLALEKKKKRDKCLQKLMKIVNDKVIK